MDAIIRTVILLLLVAGQQSCKTRESSEAQLLNSELKDATKKFFSFFTPKSIVQITKDEWNRLSVRTGTNIFKFDPTTFARITGAYQYEVRPVADSQLRVDRWRLTGAIDPGAIIESASGPLPVAFGLHAGSEVVFIRHFPTKLQAFSALPKTPASMPLSVERIQKMNAGDLVSFPVSVGVHLSLGVRERLVSFRAAADAGVFWTGVFRINIMKVDDRWVRVSIIPHKEKGTFTSAVAGFSLNVFGYDPYGVVNLDRLASKELGLDILRLVKRDTALSKTLIFEYEYDMESKVGRGVLADLLEKSLSFSPPAALALPSELKSVDKLSFINLDLSERASQLSPSVRRGMVGQTDSSGSHKGGHFGTLLLRYGGAEKLDSVDLTMVRDEGGQKVDRKLNLKNYFHRTKNTSLIEPLKQEQAVQMTVLSEDSSGGAKFSDFRFAWNMTDKLMSANEAVDYQATVNALFGNTGMVLPVLQANSAYRKFYSRIALAFDDEFFGGLRNMKQEDAQRIYLEALARLSTRFDNRYGLHSVTEATGILANIRKGGRQFLDRSAYLLENVFQRRVSGVNHSTGKDIYRLASSLHNKPFDYVTSKFLDLAKKDRLSHELIPSFLLEVGRLARLKYSVSLVTGARELKEFSVNNGQKPKFDQIHHEATSFIGHMSAQQY